MTDVATDIGLVLASVLDERFVEEQRKQVTDQLVILDQAFQQLDAKRNEMLIHKYKLEGAKAACDVFLHVLRQPAVEDKPAAAPVPDKVE